MNRIETPITKEKVAALVADAFQDSEHLLPKIALKDQLGLDVEVISLKRDPIEIYSNFSRIGLLDVNKTIQEADPRDYIGVLIPCRRAALGDLASSASVAARPTRGDDVLEDHGGSILCPRAGHSAPS